MGVTADVILKAASLAVERSVMLHSLLTTSLQKLEEQTENEKKNRLMTMQLLRERMKDSEDKSFDFRNDMDKARELSAAVPLNTTGLDINDPILNYQSLHHAALVRESIMK